MIFGQQRNQFRRVFVVVWRKHSQGVPLDSLEQSIAAVVDAHIERINHFRNNPPPADWDGGYTYLEK